MQLLRKPIAGFGETSFCGRFCWKTRLPSEQALGMAFDGVIIRAGFVSTPAATAKIEKCVRYDENNADRVPLVSH